MSLLVTKMASDTEVHCGDCLEIIASGQIRRESVNLIVTSPPYADQRKQNYGGIHPDLYVKWFLPRSMALYDCLRSDGSFVLNIKEKALAGQRHTYVIELILELRKQGWMWVDEYCWHKKNCYPGKWPNRFRDSWERLLHFTKDRRFKMNQDAVMVPMGGWKDTRLKNLSETDRKRDESKNGNGFGKKVENWMGRDLAYPSNVLHLATECGYKGHPATVPQALPEWFIRLFTDEGDTVLDSLAGSGTTLLAAYNLNRRSIGVDTSEEYCDICKHAKCGWKSTAEKIDLEYEQGDMRCIVQIKSGVNWGNSSQKASMGSSFKKAATIVRQGNPNIHVKCIEGICYGASEIKDCGSHHRYIGHAFWKEISDWDGTADAVIELIGTHASNGLNEARAEACARIVSYLRSSGVVDEQEFSQDPEQAAPLECKIRWDKLLALVLS